MRIEEWPYEVDENFKGSGTGFHPVTATIKRVFTNYDSPGYSFEEDDRENGDFTGIIWNAQGKPKLDSNGKFAGFEKYDDEIYKEGEKVEVTLVSREGKGKIKKIAPAQKFISSKTRDVRYLSEPDNPIKPKISTDITIKKAQTLNLLLQFLSSEQGKSESPLMKANKYQNITDLRKDFWDGYYELKKGEVPFASYTGEVHDPDGPIDPDDIPGWNVE